tara:strand:+ start:5093 stop:5293 length:201 start_codon:yes stop_codon:yes gene_type:complete
MNELAMIKDMIPGMKKQVRKAEMRWRRSLHEADWDYFLKKTKELERLRALVSEEEVNSKSISSSAA